MASIDIAIPCMAGHNSYKIGVFEFEMAPRNREGKFYSVLKCFEKIQSQYLADLSGYVNSKNWPQKKYLPAAISSDTHQGLLLVTDEKAKFYDYKFPNEPATYKQVWLNDETLVRLRWESNQYGTIKQPSFQEDRRFVVPKRGENSNPEDQAIKTISKELLVLSESVSNVEVESMVISTLKSQMDRLLGPGDSGYLPPSKEWQCEALAQCSELQSQAIFEDETNIREATELFSTWKKSAELNACNFR